MEKYFLTRIPAAALDLAGATQPDNIREYRWWTVAELRSTREAVCPVGLAALVAIVAEGRTPEQPVVLVG
ncbi:hypothetical protein GCM10011579_033070 [Streptomyces albiflavescens]|uniref:NUDIX hydrolase n=1 Tax=Streptomyces albiflavescens TaxID=1623582 RepID=A0A917Y3K9_9ACTN|nr:hypothetical protein [Streptomyces albiflavescens]GGN64062.1 hypothetical protein GCM10011579_033070 [Streptomyces albiflavescens]